MSHARFLVLALVMLGGCYRLHPDDGKYACDPGICPAGYFCGDDHRCWSHPIAQDMSPPPDTSCTPICPATMTCGVFTDACGKIDCGACQLTTIEPAIANPGATITLEGTFALDGAQVVFPGAAQPQTATVLGPHRAQVTVPNDATAGDLIVQTGGTTIGGLPFRRVSFALGLGPFAREYTQTSVGRQMPQLDQPRPGVSVVTVGEGLYVIGGGAPPLGTIARATINADGTLSPFAVAKDVTLATARSGHSSVVGGGAVYVIGGLGPDGSVLAGVERATINADGSLSRFTDAGVALGRARAGHVSVVVGNTLYVLGGHGDTDVLAGVERATIRGDGSLSPFSDAGVTLRQPRSDMTSAIIGRRLYLLGGTRALSPATDALRSIESATIGADGSLSDFTTVGGVALAAARAHHASVVLGQTLYVLGGDTLDSIERATIGTDDSLGSFSDAGIALRTARAGHSSVVAGNELYLIGGDALGSIERASIDVSGALSTFAPLAGSAQSIHRNSAVPLVAGHFFYIITGIKPNLYFDTIERATVSPDGTLSSFDVLPNIKVNVARWASVGAIVGNYVYVIGGGNSAGLPLDSIERATINPDGSLSAFEPAGTKLAGARWSPTCVVLGNSVYVAGGYSTVGGFDAGSSVERATIQPNGDLGAFSFVDKVQLGTPRSGHTTAVVGDSLWMIGGLAAAYLTNAERTLFSADGTLAGFGLASGNDLKEPLVAHGTLVIGPTLYTIGGYQRTATIPAGRDLDSVESAAISADGTLAPFALTPGVLLFNARSGFTDVILGNWAYVIGLTFDNERAELR